MTETKQNPNEIAEQLLEKTDGEEIELQLDADTGLSASIIRPLYLPRSTHDDVEGGSLRYAVQASEPAVDRLDLPGREGVIAAEEVESGSWTRSRVEFYEVATERDEGDEDGNGNTTTDFGDLARSHEIVAIDD